MNGHFTCNRREKRLLTELSSTGGRKQQFETLLITNYLMSSIKKTADYSTFEKRYSFFYSILTVTKQFRRSWLFYDWVFLNLFVLATFVLLI